MKSVKKTYIWTWGYEYVDNCNILIYYTNRLIETDRNLRKLVTKLCIYTFKLAPSLELKFKHRPFWCDSSITNEFYIKSPLNAPHLNTFQWRKKKIQKQTIQFASWNSNENNQNGNRNADYYACNKLTGHNIFG